MKTFHQILKFLAGLIVLSGALERGPVEAAEKPLNVLFITADDLGLQLSCYGETLIKTPHLDDFAARGVRFEVAYVAQASCSPSRSAMFTGLHTHATGQYGLTNGGFSLHPQLRDKTIPNLLKSAGYRTGIIGKLHVAPEESFQFDVRHVNGSNTRKVRQVAKLADDFLRETADEPFFLMVNYSDPHAFRRPDDRTQWHFPPQVDGLPEQPLPPSARTLFPFQQIDTPAQRVRTAGYYNAVQRLDDGVGMLMKVVEKHQHFDDTLIIFVGDHGPPFARGKTTVYEAGIRVPFIVCWPGVSMPMSSPAMVSTIDILPTILDATGVAAPGTMHGKSLRRVLAQADAAWREYLVAEFHFHGKRPFYPRRAIRDRRYKLIHNLLADLAKPSTGIDGDRAYKISRGERYGGTVVQQAFATFANPPEFELYDLKDDPIEFNNLAGKPEHRAVQQRLTEALLQYRRQTDDPFLDAEFVERMASQYAGSGAADNRVTSKPASQEAIVQRVQALRGRAFLSEGNVVEVVLNGTDVTDEDLRLVGQLRKLTDVSLENTKISDTGLMHLKDLQKLEWLNLYRTEIGDAGLKHVSHLARLQHLPIGGTRVTDVGLQHVKQMTQLKYVGLRDNDISDAGVAQLRNLTNLTGLHLGGTKLTDQGIPHLQKMTRLTRLWLSNTSVTDKVVPHLINLQQLRELHIDGTRISQQGVVRLRAALPRCDVSDE